ncbi:hypothetical protein [Maridesulfovibrio sp.]|uniref:hypothetical protein n=1 Tax=Maridesulfovibrio sp. TaxID=2795000 RepID=UPI002A1873B4|nr:hypothetical protein [Maridesulfovibrio sp.]
MNRLIITLIVLLWATPSLATESGLSFTKGYLFAAPSTHAEDLHLETDVSYVAEAQFSDDMGSVSVIRTRIKASYSIFELSYGLSHFTWENEEQIPIFGNEMENIRDPFDNLHDITLEAHLLNNRFHKDWLYWLDGTATAAYEYDFPGALGAGFQGGVAYDIWHGWMLGFGAKAVAINPISNDLFGDVEFGAILSMSHDAFMDTLELLGLDFGGSDTPHTFGVSFALSSAEKVYKSEGYIEVIRSKAGVYLDYSPIEQLTFSIGPEYYYDCMYSFYTNSGKLISKHKLSNALGGFVRFMWMF